MGSPAEGSAAGDSPPSVSSPVDSSRWLCGRGRVRGLGGVARQLPGPPNESAQSHGHASNVAIRSGSPLSGFHETVRLRRPLSQNRPWLGRRLLLAGESGRPLIATARSLSIRAAGWREWPGRHIAGGEARPASSCRDKGEQTEGAALRRALPQAALAAPGCHGQEGEGGQQLECVVIRWADRVRDTGEAAGLVPTRTIAQATSDVCRM